ncbi:MAG: APC family permease [Alphaproteobacteria bacterium]|nr:APC family permease [Alphaproteobacteria bacterium]
MGISSFLFGNPLKTESMESERLTKVKALAVFSSDAVSSVTYATEEILFALGAILAASYAMPIAGVITALIFIVSLSYWQTIGAYPNGGGAFAVAHENLGEFFGLIAAAALMIDYTLTVAVSLSAGAQAIISAFPKLGGYSVTLCISALLFLTICNLRGTQESASLLSSLTYVFIILMFMLIVGGIFVKAPPAIVTLPKKTILDSAMILLLLRSFASGCSALTGIETIAGGVTVFKKPRSHNAQVTLLIMACILGFLFIGITFIAHKFHITISPNETAISQLAHKIFGSGFFYYAIQLMTACILMLAANSAFTGFPRLASILAQEKYIPTRFANLGDRLAFSNGIIMLAVVATLLIWMFNGDCHSLIPLYSLGVFISFTLSQAGIVRRFFKLREKNWIIKALISTIGAITTFITLLIIVESKFVHGAWIVVILIPLLFAMFKKINTRYLETNTELDLKKGGLGILLKSKQDLMPKVVVPVSRIHKGTLAALRFAMSLSDDVVAVVVNVDQKEVDRLKLAWRSMNFSVPLTILHSPYRSVITPFLDFLAEQDARDPEKGKAIVVMPSFVPGQLWQNVLHNQTAAIMKTALLYKNQASEQTRVIVEIPYQMKM